MSDKKGPGGAQTKQTGTTQKTPTPGQSTPKAAEATGPKKK